MTMKDSSLTSNGNIRTYDSDGLRKRAAAVCVKDDKGEEVLLVTSKRGGQSKWVIPGGGVDPGESASEAAQREVLEEAGVKGCVVRNLGVFENHQGKHRTTVFLMRVTEELHDWEDARRMGRKRKWFPIIEAHSLLGMNKQSQQAYLATINSSIAVASSTTTTTVDFICATANGKIPNEEVITAALNESNSSTDTPESNR